MNMYRDGGARTQALLHVMENDDIRSELSQYAIVLLGVFVTGMSLTCVIKTVLACLFMSPVRSFFRTVMHLCVLAVLSITFMYFYVLSNTRDRRVQSSD